MAQNQENHQVVATCRIFPSEKEGIYKLGRLACLKEFRRKGTLGHLILGSNAGS
jgi:predicted GNAT family N-acyltransferase